MRYQVKNIWGMGVQNSIVKTSDSLHNQALLTTVNRVISDGTIPKQLRGQLMSFLNMGLREGQIKRYDGKVAVSTNKFGTSIVDTEQTRYLIDLNTSITPYEFQGGRSKDRESNKMISGVCLQRYVENFGKMLASNEINVFTGPTEEQLMEVTKKSFRKFKLRAETDEAIITIK